jgi:hypothetical protein
MSKLANVKIPPEAEQLGRLVDVHQPTETNRTMAWGSVIIGSLFACVVFVVGIVVATSENPHEMAVAMPFLFGGGFLAASALVGLFHYLHRGSRVLFFEDGIALTQGGVCWAIPWSQIETFRTRGRSISLKGRDGRTFRFLFSGFPDAAATKAKIGECIAPYLLTEYGKRFEAGEAVRFGPLSVSVYGVHHDGNVALWENLTAIKAVAVPNQVQRALKFWSEGQPVFSVSVGQIPNLSVLSHFLHQQRPDLW